MTKKLNKIGALWVPDNTIITGDRKKASWYDRALNFDVNLNAPSEVIKKIVEELCPEVLGVLGPKRNHNCFRSALKLIIINLYCAYEAGVPLRYSRSKADYAHDKRYGKLHIKYSRVIPIFDALQELGYVYQKLGYQFDGDSKQTRAWASRKLHELFHNFSLKKADFRKEPREELVILNCKIESGKKEKKIKVPYKDTEQIRAFRDNLVKYNNFIELQNVTLDIPGDALTSYQLLHNLCTNSISGTVAPLYIDYRPHYLSDKYDVNNITILTDTYTITRSLRDLPYHIREL